MVKACASLHPAGSFGNCSTVRQKRMVPASPVTCLYCRSPVNPSKLSSKHTATPVSKASHIAGESYADWTCSWQLLRKKQIWILAYLSHSFPQNQKSRAGHLMHTAWTYVTYWLFPVLEIWKRIWKRRRAGGSCPCLIAPSLGAQGQRALWTLGESWLETTCRAEKVSGLDDTVP